MDYYGYYYGLLWFFNVTNRQMAPLYYGLLWLSNMDYEKLLVGG